MQTMFTRGGLAATLAALAALACSNNAGGFAFSDVESFCTERARVECQVASRCATPVELCQQQRLNACRGEAQAAMAAGREFHPENVHACLDAVDAVYATGLIKVGDMAGPRSMADKCARVFVGTAGVNQGCASDYDCAGTRICAPVSGTPSVDGGAAPHVCAEIQPKAVGDFCADPGSTCPDGAFCSAENGAPQCKAGKPKGSPCAATLECEATLRCSEAQFCDDRLASGAECRSNDDCGPTAPFCDVTLTPMRCDAGRSFGPGSPGCIGYGTP